jgi:putative N6-adenine-specific DNA methylase
LESITRQEIQDLGFTVETLEPGGIYVRGDLACLYRMNLNLRTASRILTRLGTFFRAESFPQLHQRLAALPWKRFLLPGQPVTLRVTCRNSRLFHSDAVARTVASAIAEHMGQPSPQVKGQENSEKPPQLVVVRLADDICTVSVDSSGALLHRRGYRLAVAKAPLRETLAAGILLASGWDRTSPLIDPFCGSGTIPIEAAMIAMGKPPGMDRRFTFMDWVNFDPVTWQDVRDETPRMTTPNLRIQASDRDAGAVRMAQANAERAGVANLIQFTCQAVSAITPPPPPGWVVTNPPYGLRVSPGKDLRDLYAQFGNILRRKAPDWHLALLCSDLLLFGQMHIPLDTSMQFTNGGVHVRLGRGVVTRDER